MLKNISKEELEILSYTDLAELILKEQNKSLNTPSIFKIICDLLEYSDEEFTDKIGDFYTSLTSDKRFVFTENNEWDLREKHPVDISYDDTEDDDIVSEDEEIEEQEENEDDLDMSVETEELDDVDEDLEELSIMSDEELED